MSCQETREGFWCIIQYIFGEKRFWRENLHEYQHFEINVKLHVRRKIGKKLLKLTGTNDRIVREVVI